MAFSTQKEFFHVPFMNETVEFECKEACVKLKSYLSTTDDRSWSLDESQQSRFLADLVTCNTPVTSNNAARGSSRPGGSGLGDNFLAKHGLSGGDSVLDCANLNLSKLHELLGQKEVLQRELEVSKERLQCANEENEKIKSLMNTKFDCNYSKEFYNKIQKLCSTGKLTKNDENDLIRIYQKMEESNKAHGILSAENSYLKRLVEKLSKRATIDAIPCEPETSRDINYLQCQVNTLRKEVMLLRKSEENKLCDNQLMRGGGANQMTGDMDAETIRAIVKERNALREKCKSFKDLERKVLDLQQKAKQADKMSGSLSSNLNSQTSYIKTMEDELQRMQHYYEQMAEKMKRDEEVLRCQLEEMKEELVQAKCEAAKVERLQMEIGCLRNEVKHRDFVIEQYDVQYNELMCVIEELRCGSSASCHMDTQTQTCNDSMDELAFYATATIEEIMKELNRRCGIGSENAYQIPGKDGQFLTPNECCEELARLHNIIDRLSIDKDQLKNLSSHSMMQNEALKRTLRQQGSKLNEFSDKIDDLNKEVDKNSQETAAIGKDIADSFKLVKEISDIQLENIKLTKRLSELSSGSAQKLLDDLRAQLEAALAKNKLCQEENQNLRKELEKRGLDPDAIAKAADPTGQLADKMQTITDGAGQQGKAGPSGGEQRASAPGAVGQKEAGPSDSGRRSTVSARAEQPGAGATGADQQEKGGPSGGEQRPSAPGAAGQKDMGPDGSEQRSGAPGKDDSAGGAAGPRETASGGPGHGGPGQQGAGHADAGKDGKGQEGAGHPDAGHGGPGQQGAGHADEGKDGKGQEGTGHPDAAHGGPGQQGAGQDGKGQPVAGHDGPGQQAQGGAGPGGAGQAESGRGGEGPTGEAAGGPGQSGKDQDGAGKGVAGQGGPGQGKAGPAGPGQQEQSGGGAEQTTGGAGPRASGATPRGSGREAGPAGGGPGGAGPAGAGPAGAGPTGAGQQGAAAGEAGQQDGTARRSSQPGGQRGTGGPEAGARAGPGAGTEEGRGGAAGGGGTGPDGSGQAGMGADGTEQGGGIAGAAGMEDGTMPSRVSGMPAIGGAQGQGSGRRSIVGITARAGEPNAISPRSGQGVSAAGVRPGGTSGRGSARGPLPAGAKGSSYLDGDEGYNRFIKDNAVSMKQHLRAGSGLEKEIRAILDQFIQECNFCYCQKNLPKSKFYVICHKIIHCGMQVLSLRELGYMHKKIYMIAEKIQPGYLLKAMLQDQMGLDGEKLKCCNCKNQLCCSNSEDMLQEKVTKLERDILMAKKHLENLRADEKREELLNEKHIEFIKNFTGFAAQHAVETQELSFSSESKGMTYRLEKPLPKVTNKQLKNLKARLMKCAENMQH